MSTLRVIVNNPFQENFDTTFMENFDTTFMENEKNCQNINYFFFSFLIKNFFKWIIDHCPKPIR